MRACLARLGGQYRRDKWVAADLATSVVRERRNAAANRGLDRRMVLLCNALHGENVGLQANLSPRDRKQEPVRVRSEK